MFLLFKSMGTIIPLAFTGPSIYREIYLHRRSVWLYLYITTLNCLLRFIILVDILLFLCHWNQAVRLVSCQVKGISAKFDTVCRLVTCSRRSLRSEYHNKARILIKLAVFWVKLSRDLKRFYQVWMRYYRLSSQ